MILLVHMEQIQLDGLCYLIVRQKEICNGLILVLASFKFINKLYELVEKYKNYQSNNDENSKDINELKIIINEVAENIEAFQFNKSVAKIYEFVNILNDALLKNKLSQKNFKWS